MENTVRTAYGANLQDCLYFGLPYSAPLHSTLNEKLNILPTVAVDSQTIPTVKYFAIGCGGHKAGVGTNNLVYMQPVPHKTRDSALYNQVPFVLRLPNNDLTATEQANYRFRTLVQLNGTTYVAYYLRKLDLSSVQSQMTYNAVSNGVTTTTNFAPTSSDLNPTPPDLNPDGTYVTTGDYISVLAAVGIVFTPDDVAELLNVFNILYGSENYAIISEIALCSGVDKTVSGTFNGVTSNYLEAISVQICNFIASIYALQFNNTGINITANVGSTEPMLATTTANVSVAP